MLVRGVHTVMCYVNVQKVCIVMLELTDHVVFLWEVFFMTFKIFVYIFEYVVPPFLLLTESIEQSFDVFHVLVNF